LAKYDQLVQACLSTGAMCMLELHNFARFNGAIIGQGGPSDDAFVSLWTALASKYASQENVIFELMNEPHDLDVPTWAATCQKVVTAIRNTGAKSQMILLPGTNFDSAGQILASGSADALLAITNPDGSTDGLLLDVHKYLDIDNSGTHATCTTNNTDAFGPLADYLRSKQRTAFIGETGASHDATCMADFCEQNAFINANADVFVGLAAWGAGSFSTGYLLSLTPSKQGGKLVDNQLFSQCVLAPWVNSKDAEPPAPAPSSSAAPSGTSVPASQTSQISATSATGSGESGASSSSAASSSEHPSAIVTTTIATSAGVNGAGDASSTSGQAPTNAKSGGQATTTSLTVTPTGLATPSRRPASSLGAWMALLAIVLGTLGSWRSLP
jgi:endoglucanase